MHCDMNSGAGRLTRAARDLKDAWREVREHWNDANAGQFEKEFLQPLAPLLSQAQAAIACMADGPERRRRRPAPTPTDLTPRSFRKPGKINSPADWVC